MTINATTATTATKATKATAGAYGGLFSNNTYDTSISSVCDVTYEKNTLSVGYGVDCVSIEMKDLKDAVDKLTKTPEVHPDTITKLDIKNGKIAVKHYKDGFFESERTIMPDIKDVKVHNKTVLVTFADNTQTVAVLDKEDEFNLEQGISICITKKLLGENGGSVYNKLIKRAFKVKKQNEKTAEKAKKAKEKEKQRKELALARHKKKLAKKREANIEMHKEAYIRAMQTLIARGDMK